MEQQPEMLLNTFPHYSMFLLVEAAPVELLPIMQMFETTMALQRNEETKGRNPKGSHFSNETTLSRR